MDASKVTISKGTLESAKLSPKRKDELRREAVVALIKRRPARSRIRYDEFASITGHSTAQGAKIFVEKLIGEGLIGRQPLGLRSYSFYVNKMDEAKPAPAQVPEQERQQIVSLTEYARQFAWEHNSDSLRDFIKYMDGKELDLRRMLSKEGL